MHFILNFLLIFQRFVSSIKKILPIFTSADIFLTIMSMLGYNLRDSFITLSRYFNCESSFILAVLCESSKTSFSSSWIFFLTFELIQKSFIQKSAQLTEIAVVPYDFVIIYHYLKLELIELNREIEKRKVKYWWKEFFITFHSLQTWMYPRVLSILHQSMKCPFYSCRIKDLERFFLLI